MKRYFMVLTLVTLWSATAFGQVNLTCEQSAQTIGGSPGTSAQVTCPPGCGSSTIWGSDVYSDDSSVCTAAIHAGAMERQGGTVTVTIAPGQSDYPAVSQNGISSSHWGNWGRSFVFEDGGPRRLTCVQSGQALSGPPGTSHVVNCPPGCDSAAIWGSSVYSDDSSVCAAAVHSGAVERSGGKVLVNIAPGQSEYPSTSSNGITSSRWGSWGRSFTVVAAP